MKYLLDTHAFLWWNDAPAMLSPTVMAICKDMNNQLGLSIASIWEMQIKAQLGKLVLTAPLAEMVATQVNNGVSVLSLNIGHVLCLDNLPLHHKDPFDRLLIAQAIMEDAAVLTKDPKFQNYPVRTVW